MESKASCRDVRMSNRQAREVLHTISGMETSRAKMFLMNVMDKKEAVPFKRHTGGVGHKPGMGPGRYPMKVSKEILGVIENAEKSADAKGMRAPYIIATAITGLTMHKHMGAAAAFFPRSPSTSHGRRVSVYLTLKEKFPQKEGEKKEAKAEKKEAKVEPKEVKAETKEAKVEPKEVKTEKTEVKVEPKPEAKAEKKEPKAEAKPKPVEHKPKPAAAKAVKPKAKEAKA